MTDSTESLRERLTYLRDGHRDPTWLVMSPQTWSAVFPDGGTEADGQLAFDGVPVTIFEGAQGVGIAFDVRQ